MKFLLSILVLISCLSVHAQDDKRFIFSSDKKISLLGQKAIVNRFTPTEAEIDSVDGVLRRAFNEMPRRDKDYSLEEYYRQYAGYLDKGQRFIFVTGACFKTPFFTTDMLSAGGNGNCFFEAAIGLPSRQLDRFRFNKAR